MHLPSRTILATVLGSVLAFPVMANAHTPTPFSSLESAPSWEISQIFQSPVHAAEGSGYLLLSEQEMRETEGAWFLPVLGYSLAGALFGAAHSFRTTRTVSWRDVGAGATAGFYASPIGRTMNPFFAFGMASAGAYGWYW